jgi:DNA-binding NtrC family response regulator
VQVRVGSTVAEAERALILATLDEFAGNKQRAADALGISIKTLYNRLSQYRTLSRESA